MKISTKGRYALRLMIDLALHNSGNFVPLRDISERQGITVKYLEQIIPLLAKEGFVSSSRGIGGGYRLTKEPEQYTAGDILRAVEGSLAPIACLASEHNTCQRQSVCPTLSFWQGLDTVIKNYVDGITLKDLAKEETAPGNDYII